MFSFTIQVPPNIKVIVTYCTNDDISARWLSLGAYDFIVLALLLYFSFKNSQISPQLRALAEEGQAGTRLAVATAVFFFLIAGIFSILPRDLPIRVYFWVYVISSTFPSGFSLGAIFLPKVHFITSEAWIMSSLSRLISILNREVVQ